MRDGYKVKEIFGPTLQGEGTHVGLKVIFVRLSGCNRWTGKEQDRSRSICSYCDTDFVGGEQMSALEICEAVMKLSDNTKDVVLSGGEPTLQMDLVLLTMLKLKGYRIHLETNGSRDISHLYHLLYHVTISPKQNYLNTKQKECHDLKMLFPYISTEITTDEFSGMKVQNKYLQPIMGPNYSLYLKQTIAKLYQLSDWKLSLQTHKITGVE